MSKKDRNEFAQRTGSTSSTVTVQHQHIGDSMDEVTAEYIAIFLSATSQQTLLDAFPSAMPTRYADHVTLEFRPDMKRLPAYAGSDTGLGLGLGTALPIGTTCHLVVTGVVQDDCVQTASVKLSDVHVSTGPDVLADAVDTSELHCTIRPASGVPPKDSLRLLREAQIKRPRHSLELTGVVGAKISYRAKDQNSTLPDPQCLSRS